MNKTALKNFATAARWKLISRVTERAGSYGITAEICKNGQIVPSSLFQRLGGKMLTAGEIKQRDALIRHIESRGFAQVIEEAAYTWFNRFIALRFMQEHNLLPVSYRVLPDAPGLLPEIVQEAHAVELPGVDPAQVMAMIEQSQSEVLYKSLLLALCNQLNAPLPQMFEPIGDATELLLPDGLLREDSVLAAMCAVKAEDWVDIQVVGWLYQYYNADLKDETFDLLKKNVKITKERIGAATQLFTPEWIVRYMVQNSLGRLWLEGHPSDSLRMQWRYYLDEAEQPADVAARLAELRRDSANLQPEQITVLDPCMGSGHILIYAMDLLMEIYRTCGYTDRDAVQSIMQNNLYGLDIDDRAAQLAYFALMMRACEYDRRFLRRGIQPHVCAIQEWTDAENWRMQPIGWTAKEIRAAQALKDAFLDAKEYGSILPISEELTDLLDELPETAFEGDDLVQSFARQARIMARQYDVVVTNPPYMGSSGMNAKLSAYVKENYPDSKSDLFAVFMERCGEMVKEHGYQAMITMHSWMFLSSFEELRKKLLQTKTINTMMHLGMNAFSHDVGTIVQTTSFVLRKRTNAYIGTYCRLIGANTPQEKERMYLSKENRFATNVDCLQNIPGNPIVYWISKAHIRAFETGVPLEDIASPRQGLATGDNARFLRLWHEVQRCSLCDNASNIDNFFASQAYYAPYNKGGTFRKWYGNIDWVIRFDKPNYDILQTLGNHLPSKHLYFRECFSWSLISLYISFRYKSPGTVFDVAGMSCFVDHDFLYLMAMCNSIVALDFLRMIAPTMNYQCGDIARLPVLLDFTKKSTIEVLTKSNINIAREDWDSFETSWDFKKHPLI